MPERPSAFPKGKTLNTHIVPTIERAESGSLVVTSETIAEGSGVEHRAVLQLIMKRTLELEQFGQVAFEMRAGYNNAQVRVALLNEQQATLLMSFQKNTDQVIAFKVALVKGFFEMARQLQAPAAEITKSDLARMVLESESEKLALSSKLEVAQPKADFMDTYVSGDGDSMLLRTVASTLRVHEGKLRDLLIAAEWIYAEDSSRRNSKGVQVPQRRYSEYSHKKLCFIRNQEPRAPRFRGELDHTLKVTPVGATSIDKLLHRALEEFGDIDTAVETLEARRQERIKARKAKDDAEVPF